MRIVRTAKATGKTTAVNLNVTAVPASRAAGPNQAGLAESNHNIQQSVLATIASVAVPSAKLVGITE